MLMQQEVMIDVGDKGTPHLETYQWDSPSILGTAFANIAMIVWAGLFWQMFPFQEGSPIKLPLEFFLTMTGLITAACWTIHFVTYATCQSSAEKQWFADFKRAYGDCKIVGKGASRKRAISLHYVLVQFDNTVAESLRGAKRLITYELPQSSNFKYCFWIGAVLAVQVVTTTILKTVEFPQDLIVEPAMVNASLFMAMMVALTWIINSMGSADSQSFKEARTQAYEEIKNKYGSFVVLTSDTVEVQ